MSAVVVPNRSSGGRCSRLLLLFPPLLLLIQPEAIRAQSAATGPGDPTTVLATGLNRPCRMAFDEHGELFIAEIITGEIRRVTPTGTVTLFHSGLADYRGIVFDAFGDLLLSDRTDDKVHRISPQGTATVFADVLDPYGGGAIAPDGDVWIPASGVIHHFTPLGVLVESIDIASQGLANAGPTFSPSGELYMASWGGLWKLQGGVVSPILTGMTVRNWGVTFDLSGNFVQAREAVEAGDTHRIILRGPNGSVVDDSLVTQVVGPCATAFARDASGATTKQLVIAQTNGTLLRANAVGIPSAGLPVVPISLRGISPDAQLGALAGQQSALTANEVHFLDAIGNRNASFDVGDFRAFLIATGTVPSPVPGLAGAPALAALSGIRR